MNSAYALRIVATSQTLALSIRIYFNPEWVRVGLTPFGRATQLSAPTYALTYTVGVVGGLSPPTVRGCQTIRPIIL